MKKRLMLLFIMIILFSPIGVNASNRIYSINMDINILENGDAKIKEVWDVDGDDGTEWYKVINDLGNSKILDFSVLMDGRKLEYKDWQVNESLKEKRGYYGIVNTDSGVELCFGKYDYKRHKFTLSYTITDFIFNVDDAQVIYFNFIDRLSNVDFDNFSIVISSYYKFSDKLDVWGYGYKGYAYVEDGKIKMSNEGDMDDNYVVLLAKFPLNSFNTMNKIYGYDNFNDIYNMAEDGTFEYDYDDVYEEDRIGLLGHILNILPFIIPLIVVFISIFSILKNGYGYKGNKVINKKDIPLFRDIPCNKDIYYANALIKLNDFGYKESNILGAIILKWVRNKKIGFRNETKGIFNKESSVIDLTMNPSFDNELEKKLFDLMFIASEDGMLEAKEFEKWCRKNYTEFFDLFKLIETSEENKLRREGHIYIRNNKDECKKKNVMDDYIYNDSVKLYGLKKFLQEFSRMDTKEVMEVHLWDEYLMFAYLFGIADKVAKQLKNMYPEVIEQEDFNYDTIIFVNNISTRSVNAASSARSAAENYSSGGGGFSSGGGGFGSFGGGGGGSR